MKSPVFVKFQGDAIAPHAHLRNRGMRLSLGLLVQFLLDLLMLSGVYVLAYGIRFEFVLSELVPGATLSSAYPNR